MKVVDNVEILSYEGVIVMAVFLIIVTVVLVLTAAVTAAAGLEERFGFLQRRHDKWLERYYNSDRDDDK